jgi:hypothetical protein
MKFEIPENNAFGFSGVDPEDMANPEDEYTLVSIAEDVSPSTNGVRGIMCDGKKLVNQACKKSPRADKLMIHYTKFGSRIEEDHGFKPVMEIDEDDYKPSQSIGGSTCLYDAVFNGLAAIQKYAEVLDKSDIGTNGIVFVYTDGMDNASTLGAQSIVDKIEEIKMKEILESVKIIVIGFYDTKSSYASEIRDYLDAFVKDIGLDQFVDVGGMTSAQAAKVFGFVSQSISSQSQNLGTGGPSQNLTF